MGYGFGQLQATAELARRGTRLHPAQNRNWLVLSSALAHLGDLHAAAECLREALTVLPPSAELHRQLAELLASQDLWEEALVHAERTLSIAPDDRDARRLRFEALAVLGAREDHDLDAVGAFAAESPRLLAQRARSLGPAATVELCDVMLAEKPGHCMATYLKAVALARLGCMEEARRMISLDRLIETRQLAVPPGYADERSFGDALAAEIRANPTLGADPRAKATRGGLQTRSLRQPGAVAIEALLARFRQAVDAYEERLLAAGNEFALIRPRRARLRAWAVIYGANGRQKSHMHPAGWLSGVYYVSAPRRNGENAYRGPLVLGALEPGQRVAAPPWGTSEVEPVPGRLVLFPSYVPHATLPSGISGERISVAFDVIEAAQPAALH